MTKNIFIFFTIWLLYFNLNGTYGQEESLAGSFLSGLLDTITNTADSKDCPGVCVHTLATLICYDVLEDIPCPSKNMKCCIESAERQPVKSVENTTVQATSSTTKQPANSQFGSLTKLSNNSSSTPRPKIKNKDVTTNLAIIPAKINKSVEKNISDSLNCSGVCVADKIAEYCEAFYTSKGRCKTGSKCCISLDEFINKELPFDLYVPAKHLINLGMDQTTQKGNSTRTESLKIINNKHTQNENLTNNTTTIPKPSDVSNTKPNVNSSSLVITNKQNKLKKTKLPHPIIYNTEESTEKIKTPGGQDCKGECMNGILAIFCDDIDTEAFCPGEGSCCINNMNFDTTTLSYQNTSIKRPLKQTPSLKSEVESTTIASQTAVPNISGSDLFSQILTFAENTLNSPVTTTPSHPSSVSSPQTAPRCPGFCLLNIMAAFCEPPSIILYSKTTCSRGSVCCDNSKNSPQDTSYPVSTQSTSFVIPNTPQPDPREPCPGSCIVSLLRFTCFKNAELTHLFKCKRSGQTCCAPKSKILDKQQFQTRNDTSPFSGTHYTQPQNPNYFIIDAQNSATTIANKPPHSSTLAPVLSSTTRYPVYSKYVCGVKGTLRSKRKSKTSQYSFISYTRAMHGLSRSARQIIGYSLPKNFSTKSNERLMLGSKLVPIQIKNNYLIRSLDSESDANLEFNHKYSIANITKQRIGRVVNGEDAENGEWCWQVALINSANQYLCGGGLIGTQWVLTAAHCVTNIVRSGDAIYVRVGDYDLTRKYGSPGAQTLRVATTYIHHNHNSQTLDNDIALLKLHGQAELRDGVCLVCLPARGVNHAAGKRCTVTGYGYMGETGPIPLRIREAELPIVSDAECIRKVNAVTEKIFILPASSFCAGGEENDACQGDGGGPLVCEDDGFYELAGLVSWGFGCGRLDVPGVYVKVSSFIGWVNQIISVNNL